jgi:hypothetical protein
MNRQYWIYLCFLFLGCGEVVPQPKEYDGWERLYVKQLDWPAGCSIPPNFFVVSDTARLHRYQCDVDISDIDLDNWDFVIYYEGWFNQITSMTVGDFVYISHEQKKIEIVPATSYKTNTSGLTSVGFDAIARHFFIMPKVPKGYSVNLKLD